MLPCYVAAITHRRTPLPLFSKSTLVVSPCARSASIPNGVYEGPSSPCTAVGQSPLRVKIVKDNLIGLKPPRRALQGSLLILNEAFKFEIAIGSFDSFLMSISIMSEY